MPAFEKTYESAGDKLAVVAVNAGFIDNESEVNATREKFGLRMPIAMDDGTLGRALNMPGTPMHVLVGRDGRIAYIGTEHDAKLEAAIQKVIHSPAPSAAPATAKAAASVTALKPGDIVPMLTVKNAQGVSVPLRASGANRAQAIVFFGTWCESYLAESRAKTSQACKRIREQS